MDTDPNEGKSCLFDDNLEMTFTCKTSENIETCIGEGEKRNNPRYQQKKAVLQYVQMGNAIFQIATSNETKRGHELWETREFAYTSNQFDPNTGLCAANSTEEIIRTYFGHDEKKTEFSSYESQNQIQIIPDTLRLQSIREQQRSGQVSLEDLRKQPFVEQAEIVVAYP